MLTGAAVRLMLPKLIREHQLELPRISQGIISKTDVRYRELDHVRDAPSKQ